MLNLKKLHFITYIIISANSFGQITKNQSSFDFKQNWVVKKNYIFSGKLLLENVKKDKKSPLFVMNSGYKICPISYKNSILTAKAENLLTKKHETIKINVLTGFLIDKKTPSLLSLVTGIWPQKNIKTGDKWTLETQDTGKLSNFFGDKSILCTYRFKEIASFQKIPCAKVELKINEGLNKNLKGSGIAWIQLKDGLMNHLDLDFIHTLPKPTADGVTKHLMKINIKQAK